jgi:hypothetical protein
LPTGRKRVLRAWVYWAHGIHHAPSGERRPLMATFNEDVVVNGNLRVVRPWADWLFLEQQRDVQGGGGFHVHNPWGNSNQPQGAADRDRLEIAYRTDGGQDLWGQLVLHGPSGNVGIGTVSPQQKLVVAGGGAQVNGVAVGTDVPSIDYQFEYETVGVSQTAFNLRLQSPNAIILHTGGNPPGEKVIITADGDIRLLGADCAEYFDSAEGPTVEPGSVLVIANEGALRECDTEYDKRVAGVVSGGGGTRPGIVLDNGAQGSGVAVALTGKAYCKVDADEGVVEVGDLLTTSATVGHAMKANDGDRRFGSVLGKALAPLAEGRALIPILVALQ